MFAPPVAKPKQSAPQPSAATRMTAQASTPTCASGASVDLSTVPARDSLEREADSTADKVLAMPQPPATRASAPITAGRGDALPPRARDFFEPRFGHDFGNVRVHHGADASRSAAAFGARAYTLGRNIVFGEGQYAPHAAKGRHLLAHELTHVVQQSRGPKALQRSPLSDAMEKDLGKGPKLEAVLARLGKDDVQNAPTDGDVDKLIDKLLTNPDDNWVAHRVRQGKIGDTKGWADGGKPKPQPVKAVFFQGTSDRRALVIAGVHGTETQGMEVADMLVADLKKPGNPPPLLSAIIVPRMFPDNDAHHSREGLGAKPNRNFPDVSKNLEQSKDKTGDPRAATGQKILPENIMLIELMEKFHPERIISIHGTWGPGSAGVFYDPRTMRPDEIDAARKQADAAEDLYEAGNPEDARDPDQNRERRTQLRRLSGSAKAQDVDRTDRDLSLDAAKQIDTDTAGLAKTVPQKGGGTKTVDPRLGRSLGGSTKEMKEGRKAHPSVAGNVGKDGAFSNPTWEGGTDDGVSLGGYASKRGISIFTVEPPMDAESALYPDTVDPAHPGGTDRASGKIDTLAKADRITELQAYATAVRTILLGR